MKLILYILLVVGVTANAQEILYESSQNLGYGFRLVSRSEQLPYNPNAFESVGHFTYFFYKEKNLSQTGIYSISPSGKYALYQDGPSGKVMLFQVNSGVSTEVAKTHKGLVDKFEWHESEKTVFIYFNKVINKIEVKLNP